MARLEHVQEIVHDLTQMTYKLLHRVEFFLLVRSSILSACLLSSILSIPSFDRGEPRLGIHQLNKLGLSLPSMPTIGYARSR